MKASDLINKLDDKYYKKYLSKYLAKSTGEKLEDHFKDLMENTKLFIKYFPDLLDDYEKKILHLAIYLHDFGKMNKLFQKKIKDHKTNDLIPHNYLSPLFLYEIKDYLNDEELLLLFYSIINHHKRGSEYIKEGKNGLQMFINYFRRFNTQFGIVINNVEEIIRFYKKLLKTVIIQYTKSDIITRNYEENNDFFKRLVKLSGLLIRIDHSSSGGMVTEEEPIKQNRKKLLLLYLNEKNKSKKNITINLRPFQKKFKDENSLVLVADTGLGKTGLAVLWAKRKMFYILPNRTSTNAMFSKFIKIYNSNKVGLLHSTSYYYLMDKNSENKTGNTDLLVHYDLTKTLSKPVTVCTADQLFIAAFKYPGYEKIYATLSYSDVVIDEIQGFSPQQIVPMLRQIRETMLLGARYLIITATLPEIIKEKFIKMGLKVVGNNNLTYDNKLRHKIKIERNKSIFSFKDEMLNSKKNVLVVVNTVATAQKLYKKLIRNTNKNINNKKIKILHSRFIYKSRIEKEKAIKNPENVIWICTQLVEASLDIDFDILFTEESTADSLIQRMGRIWRHKIINYEGDFNIIIAGILDNNSYKIYEEILVTESLNLIEENLDEKKYLASPKKREIVSLLYSSDFLKQINSNYLKKWHEVEKILDAGLDFVLESEAHRTFRDLFTVNCIPDKYSTEAVKISDRLIELDKINMEKNGKRKRRFALLKELNNYKVSVPFYYVFNKNKTSNLTVINSKYDIGILPKYIEYNDELGILKPDKYSDYGQVL